MWWLVASIHTFEWSLFQIIHFIQKLRYIPFKLMFKKGSRKFCNILATLYDFAEVMKVTNHTWLWNAKLAWYSLSAIRRICLSCLEHGFGIQTLRPTRLPNRRDSWNPNEISCTIWFRYCTKREDAVDQIVSPPFAQQMFLVASRVLKHNSNS